MTGGPWTRSMKVVHGPLVHVLSSPAGRVLRAPDIQFGDLEFKCRSDRQLDLLIYKTFVDLQNTTIIYCCKRK